MNKHPTSSLPGKGIAMCVLPSCQGSSAGLSPSYPRWDLNSFRTLSQFSGLPLQSLTAASWDHLLNKSKQTVHVSLALCGRHSQTRKKSRWSTTLLWSLISTPWKRGHQTRWAREALAAYKWGNNTSLLKSELRGKSMIVICLHRCLSALWNGLST